MKAAAIAARRVESAQTNPLPVGWLASLLVFAAIVRWCAYSGYFGSDEVTYTQAAFALLDGDWTVSHYVGANRYGVNLPVAFFGWLFGRNEFSAAAYSLLCSLAEVMLVTWFGVRMFGPRAGLLAGFALATLPIHVHFAGRLMADAPLALAVTASFLFFWDGEARKRRLSFFIAGLAAGWSFWIKPAAFFYLGVFLTYPLIFRKFDPRWGWMIVGFALVMVANGIFFSALTGRFWFVFENMAERRASGYLQEEFASGGAIGEPGYYLVYLFGKVYHTWLLGYLAVGAIGQWLYRRRQESSNDHSMPFVIWWGSGLLFILSMLVISISPLTFVPKQTNYMLMFVAPLALLSGNFLAPTRGLRSAVLVALVTVPAVMFSLLLQARVMVFTSNSKATWRFALENPGVTIYANTNSRRFAEFLAILNPKQSSVAIHPIADWSKATVGGAVRRWERFAVIDMETLAWGANEPFRSLQDRPACWVAQGMLTPVVEGLGPRLVQLMASIAFAMRSDNIVGERLAGLTNPMPAHLFRIPDVGC